MEAQVYRVSRFNQVSVAQREKAKQHADYRQLIENEDGQSLIKNLEEYIQVFYGSFFHSDQDFETNLITYVKHYISKTSRLSYWHCAFDDTGKLQVSHLLEAQSRIVLNITGVKQGYDKQLVIFSIKGAKGNILDMMKNKWLQVISFFAMLLIFIAAVGCESQNATGMCFYKNQLMIGGAAVMMGLMGMRIASRKKGKKTKNHVKTD